MSLTSPPQIADCLGEGHPVGRCRETLADTSKFLPGVGSMIVVRLAARRHITKAGNQILKQAKPILGVERVDDRFKIFEGNNHVQLYAFRSRGHHGCWRRRGTHAAAARIQW